MSADVARNVCMNFAGNIQSMAARRPSRKLIECELKGWRRFVVIRTSLRVLRAGLIFLYASFGNNGAKSN